MELPTEIITYILSFGDPLVTEQFRNTVIKQIKYLKKEFDYCRKDPTNCYYKMSKEYVYYFMLIRTREKMYINCSNQTLNIKEDSDTHMFSLVLRMHNTFLS